MGVQASRELMPLDTQPDISAEEVRRQLVAGYERARASLTEGRGARTRGAGG